VDAELFKIINSWWW